MADYKGPIEQVDSYHWRIPKSFREDMRVDGLIFADERLIEQIRKDNGPEQVANVATLPGIQKASLAMPDIHWGYGFCIGGVAAVVLGILAITGTKSVPLSLIGLLVMGATLLLTGSTLSGVVQGFMRPTATYRRTSGFTETPAE